MFFLVCAFASRLYFGPHLDNRNFLFHARHGRTPAEFEAQYEPCKNKDC